MPAFLVLLSLLAIFASESAARAQATVSIDTSSAGKQQVIDGFGTLSSGPVPAWYNNLYLNDMYCSMVRVYLTPSFVSPYSDHLYNSPWYGNSPALPGPDGNNVRTYTGASASTAQPYTRAWMFNDPNNNNQPTTQAAQIAVMGPDIDANGRLLVINPGPAEAGVLAQIGQGAKLQQLGDFKLFGSFWSPQPWVKLTSGNTYPPNSGTPFPTAGTPFPFIWNGNFAGGILDVTGTTLPEFNDGTQDTSAMTQFVRMVSAQLRKIQNQYGVKFYAISIQNEPNFEEFYDSCQYPAAAGYVAAVEAVRTELNRYPDLAGIKIEGPEDVLGDDAYSMWQYGSGNSTTDKNLKFVAGAQSTPAGASALSFFSIHGYDNNGVSSSGTASPTGWNYWTKGWTTAPAPGLPNNVQGITAFQKKSWMTETSGESAGWLDSSTQGGFPDSGAFSIALKLHQALTAGQESAWVYYEFNDGTTPTDASSLTDGTSLANGPKYVAAKHFFRYIRPNSYRVNTTVAGSSTLLASSYVNDGNQSLTTVLINSSSSATTATVTVPVYPPNITSFQTFTSSNGSYWQPTTTAVQASTAVVSLPAYSVATLTANSPLQLLSAVSRQQQGSAAYDIPLALAGTPAIECRGTPNAETYTIVLNFNEAVSGGAAQLGLQAGQSPNLHINGSAGTPTTSGSTMTISLTGVADEQRTVLHVTGVQPGNLSYDIPMNVLWADVDGNGAVNSQDLVAVRNGIGKSAGQSGFNARADIDENGAVNSQDLVQVRNDIATTLP